MKSHKILIFICILFTVLTQSCALIFSGASQKIVFSCPQDSANVYLNKKPVGKVNQPIKIARCDLNKLVTIKKAGYSDTSFEMQVKENHLVLLDIIPSLTVIGLLFPLFDYACDADDRVDKIQYIALKPKQTQTME